MKEFIAKIRQRYNPSSRWTDVDPVLDAGEIGIESDTGFFKFGDGRSKWTELGYAMTHATVEVDETLELKGQAADAKATGDRLEYLEQYVHEKTGGLGATLKIEGLKIVEEGDYLPGKEYAEIGESYIQVLLKWTVKQTPLSGQLISPNGDVLTLEKEQLQKGSYEYIDTIDKRKDWIWTLNLINHFNKSEAAKAGLYFRRFSYYGSYIPQEGTSAYIIKNKNKTPLKSEKEKSLSFKMQIPVGEQPFIALPKEIGEPSISIKEGNSSGSVTATEVDKIYLPADCSEKDQTQYIVWNFSYPPSTPQNWEVAISWK